MKINVGNTDRIVRIVAGVALITLAVTGIFAPWGWIGIILLVTGVIKFCPIYGLIGMSSCPTDKK